MPGHGGVACFAIGMSRLPLRKAGVRPIIGGFVTSLFSRVHRRLLRGWSLPAPLTSIGIAVAGRRFVAPVIDRRFAEPGEPWIVDLFRALLPARPGTFVDVGVNIGQTLMVVKAIEPGRRYVGFEPNPRCVAYCERLIADNGLDGITLVPAGLAETSGLRRLQFYSATKFDSAASVVENFRPGEAVTGEAIVTVVSMRDAMKTLDPGALAIVKIDTEGAESEILAAMRDAIAGARPWIVTEVLPPYAADNVARMTRQAAIERLLAEIDYRILRIQKSPDERLAGLVEIASFGVHGDVRMSDYVLAPAEDVPAIMALVRRDV